MATLDTTWKAKVMTLFPEMFPGSLSLSLAGQGQKDGVWSLETLDIRDFAHDKHRSVDDAPFGGGPGMLMKTEPLLASIRAARAAIDTAENAGQLATRVIYLSPQGRKLDQQAILELAKRRNMILVCGRYQGIDTRVLDAEIDEEWSLGDFVLSGGEIAAMALIDAVTRYQPGALGDEDSAQQDSFATGLLHSPQYTRPQSVAGREVPEVLLSGDHEAIRRWRLKQSLGVTWLKRPDLLSSDDLTAEQQQLLTEFKAEYTEKN